jgi:hypothetical protein
LPSKEVSRSSASESAFARRGWAGGSVRVIRRTSSPRSIAALSPSPIISLAARSFAAEHDGHRHERHLARMTWGGCASLTRTTHERAHGRQGPCSAMIVSTSLRSGRGSPPAELSGVPAGVGRVRTSRRGGRQGADGPCGHVSPCCWCVCMHRSCVDRERGWPFSLHLGESRAPTEPQARETLRRAP